MKKEKPKARLSHLHIYLSKIIDILIESSVIKCDKHTVLDRDQSVTCMKTARQYY